MSEDIYLCLLPRNFDLFTENDLCYRTKGLFFYLDFFCRDKIETFIDENKALMKRMYGDFEMSPRYPPSQPNRKRKRHVQGMDDDFTILPDLMDLYGAPGSLNAPEPILSSGDSYFGRLRDKRQSTGGRANGGSGGGGAGAAAASTGGSGNGSGSRSNGRPSAASDSSGESTGRQVLMDIFSNSII